MRKKERLSSGRSLAAGAAGPEAELPLIQAIRSKAQYHTKSNQSTTSEPLAYSLEGAAEVLSIGLSTLKELCRTGQITSLKVGARRLISRKELERFLALREEELRLSETAKTQLQLRINDLQQMLDGLE